MNWRDTHGIDCKAPQTGECTCGAVSPPGQPERDSELAPLQKRPVAWRVKDFADGWILCHTEEVANHEAEEMGGALVQGLYVRDGN